MSKRIVGQFFEPMKVHAFPFDQQRLVVKFFFNDCYKLHRSLDMPTGTFGQLVNNEWYVYVDTKLCLPNTGFELSCATHFIG